MNALFLLKKIISQFLSPMTFCLALAFAGLYLARFTKKRRAGLLMAFSGLIILSTFSYSFVADSLVVGLEYGLKTFDPAYLPENAPAGFIVVLAGGVAENPDIPATSQLGASTLERLVEGIRIYRKLPGSKLLLSGGSVFGMTPEAVIMKEAACEMGVPGDDILLEASSRDTADEAVLIKPMVGNSRFVLVTSAAHMKRSMLLFEKIGMRPIPAPAGHYGKGPAKFGPSSFFPESSSLSRSEAALHEYIGIIWAKITKLI